ncbi:MAG: TetR/AcrR family transcriptional regulator [Acidimicrobiales bacterium]
MSPPKRASESTTALRASLVGHARRLIARDGASALTMRALAAEAGCAVGLPYKVFTDRSDLVAEICHAEFNRLADASGELVTRAGTRTVGANLAWFAEQLLGSPAVSLAHEVLADQSLAKVVTARVHQSGVGPGAFETVFANYLAAEQQAGRVASDIDEKAFGFVLAGAIHNLIMSGDAWPRPTRRQLQRKLDAIALAIAPKP